MKLHLPKGLRKAMLNSVVAVAATAATLGSSAYGYRFDVPQGGAFWGGDYAITFTVTGGKLSEQNQSDVLFYYGGNVSKTDSVGANAAVLNYTADGVTLTLGRGKMENLDDGVVSASTQVTYASGNQYTFDAKLTEGQTYTLVVRDGGTNGYDMTATLCGGDLAQSETLAAYDGRMNGQSMQAAYNGDYVNTISSPGVWNWNGTGETATLDYTSSNWTNTTIHPTNPVKLWAGYDIEFGADTSLAKKLNLSDCIYVNTVKVNDNYTLTGTSADAKLDASTITIANDKTLTLTSTTGNAISVKGNITGGKLQVDSAVSFEAGDISSIIQGTGSVTKAGPGTLTLSGANTYTGGTTISGGELIVNSISALGTGMVTVQNGAILNANSKKDAMAAIAGVTLQAGATLKNVGNGMWANESQLSTLILEGDATINASARFGLVSTTGTGDSIKWNNTSLELNGNTLTISGGQGFVFAETKTSDGDTGIINVTSKIFFGHAERGDTSNLSGATISLAQNAEMHVEHNNASVTVAGLTGSGSVTNGGEIILNGSGAYVFSGVIKDYTGRKGSLIKSGTGTLTLSGANTYTGGTTIKKGILALSGNGALGTGLVTIEKDGTLKTNGSTAAMTVTGAGAIDLGNTTALNATLDSNWTGTVKLSGAKLADADLNAYGNENSTVQLNSSTGSLKAGDVNTKVELKGGPAFKVTETTGKTVTFNNAISGDANFVVEATGDGANTGTDTYEFKGDVSNWKKATDAKQDVGFIAASDTKVTYEGNATTINHGIYANAGKLDATIGGENAVTVNGDISNSKWDTSAGKLNLTVANSSATGVTFNNAVKADSITVNSNSKATFNNQAEATALTVGEKATATFTQGTVNLTNVTLEKDSSMTATNLTIAEGGSLIFGNGTSLTVTGSLTLDVNSIKLADGFEFATTAPQQLISQTGNLTAEAVASWNGGEYVVDGKTYTAGLSMENNVLSLTLNEVPSKDFVSTSVVEKFTVEGVEQYMYTPDGTSLTLNVTAGSLAGLKEGGLVELGLISEGMKQALLQDERLDGDEVTLFLTDGKTTIEAGKDAIVGFYNDDHEGYWGKQVGSNRVYEIDRIPEPTTSALSLIGLAALAMRRRRK